MRSRGLFKLLIFLVLPITYCYAQETLTITTYYPSPFGNYQELRAQRMAIGNNYVGAAYCWPPASCANAIDANADLVVEGNVGIGTTSPYSKLQVAGSTVNTLFSNVLASLNGGIEIGYDSPSQVGIIRVMNGAGAFMNPLYLEGEEVRIRTASGGIPDRVIVDQNGNVGIGTMTPDRKLRVIGIPSNSIHTARFDGNNGYAVGIGGFRDAAGVNSTYGAIQSWGGANPANLVINKAGGNVGIGTTSPRTTQDGRTLRLDVANNIVTNDVYLASPVNGSPRWASQEGNRFGGIYMTGANGNPNACRYTNPITGGCSCPSGYNPFQFWEFAGSGSGFYESTDVRMFQCIK